MRLFVAVTLGEAIEAEASAGIQRLEGLAPRARWVPADNLHLTLHFLGEVEAERVPAIQDALERVGPAHAPRIREIGARLRAGGRGREEGEGS